ncbi:MAG: hypothetical protein ACPKPY_04120 [Nitrososphaeraceae archaeon]
MIENWSTAEDSFSLDPPNAVLVVEDKQEQQDIAIAELFNPLYDYDKKVLKYDIIPDNATSIELQKKFGQTTIVIDAIGPGGVPPWED